MKTTLYMAMTVNGFIAKEDDETPWSEEEWRSFAGFVEQSRNLIIGRKTYELMREANQFEKIGNPFAVVLSGSEEEVKEGFVFVKSPSDALKALEEKGFDCALIGGGALTNTVFIKQGLIDEIILDIEPMIFGKGITLFAGEDFETRLEFIEMKKLSGNTIQLRYRVKR
ncbi:MAG: dihydrofolate reductase family protein [Candidatus Uhrbacteria bacterium]|nr:dihydrofolate reductase family protein [Candidatus Uhrbacteria bacterium]